jgi:hypothetical protein
MATRSSFSPSRTSVSRANPWPIFEIADQPLELMIAVTAEEAETRYAGDCFVCEMLFLYKIMLGLAKNS